MKYEATNRNNPPALFVNGVTPRSGFHHGRGHNAEVDENGGKGLLIWGASHLYMYYVFRMWGGVVPIEEIENGLALLKAEMKVRNHYRVTMQFI